MPPRDSIGPSPPSANMGVIANGDMAGNNTQNSRSGFQILVMGYRGMEKRLNAKPMQSPALSVAIRWLPKLLWIETKEMGIR